MRVVGCAAVLAAAGILVAGCGGSRQGAGNQKSGDTQARTIVYEVTGSGSASRLSYFDGEKIEEAKNVTLPWSRTIQTGSTDELFVSVNGAPQSTVNCRMTVDGREADQRTDTSDNTVVGSVVQCAARPGRQQAADQHQVVLEVTGSGPVASLSHEVMQHSPAVEESDVQVPWRRTLEVPARTNVRVTARADVGTSVDCRITVDGKEYDAEQASADMPLASCMAVIG